jgi:hypothetical protein
MVVFVEFGAGITCFARANDLKRLEKWAAEANGVLD